VKTILDTIIEHKRKEVAEQKSLHPVKLLEKSIYFHSPVVSLVKYLKNPQKTGIIAEFKRKSPSKGDINPHAEVARVTIGYMMAGASALSVLTDNHFFGGSNADLTIARDHNFCPVLRKEFIVDEYQVLEARAIGADAILLIAAVLTKDEVKNLAALAKSLGLEVLMEIHNTEELEKITPGLDVIGINNRNLKDFSVSIDHSLDLFEKIPSEFLRISESGITHPEKIQQLRAHGFDGFLIGEAFMRHARPEHAFAEFVKKL